MKTKTLVLAIITFLLSVNIYAAEPVIYRNEIATDFGKQIEQTIFVKDSSAPNKRLLSSYNHGGQLIEGIIYKWNSYRGWMPVAKRVYEYKASNELATVTYTKWNERTGEWDKKSEIAHYDTVGNNSIFLVEKGK